MPPKPKKTYDVVGQGIKVLVDCDGADVDIVCVPGLGANPEESWKSNDVKNPYNWISDDEGLKRDFPKARVLLYQYESAWSGALKVKQFLGNIATTLLHGLSSAREDCRRRPVVFIGHSMGGLVVSKAIVTAESRRDLFPLMFEAITGCLFFGTPFSGTKAAAAAAMLAAIGEKIDVATSSKLLDQLKPDDESLNELRNDFVRLAGKLTPKIELFCFYEEQPTDFAKLAGLPDLFGLWKMAIPKDIQEFVTRASATLTGVDRMGMACIHRDLVKFDGFKDTRYQLVRDPLKRIVHGAQLTAKNRLSATRDLDRTLVKGVLDALDGISAHVKRRSLAKVVAASAWVTNEAEYIQWRTRDGENASKDDSLWIRGAEGASGAALAIIENLENMIKSEEEANPNRSPALLAYHFCGGPAEFNTAEDLVKSLMRQLVDQQEGLASYAKQFVKKTQPRVTPSVENLWQSLLEMLSGQEHVEVYFVVDNLHALPADSDSTTKLLAFIKSTLQVASGGGTRTGRVRWLITSRENRTTEAALTVDEMRLINLEDPKYGNQVQNELRKHAQLKVALLRAEKRYNKALAYFASSLMGKRAQNTQWIDITCINLAELPPDESDLKIRAVLERAPQDLKLLLDRAWNTVFCANEAASGRIREILRALVLTYDDPTEAELAMLAGFLPDSEACRQELRDSIDQCKPLLTCKKSGRGGRKISFMNAAVKNHLLENSKELLFLSGEETRWQHGMMSLRCFSHLTDRLSPPVEEEKSDVVEGHLDGEEQREQGRTETDGGPAANHDDATGVGASAQGDQNDGEPRQIVNAEDEAIAGEVPHEVIEHDITQGDGESAQGDDNPYPDDQPGDSVDGEEAEDEEGTEEDQEEEEEESDEEFDSNDETPQGEDDDWPELESGKALDYAVKHWLHHASKATREVAEDLSLEEDFWKPDSILRKNWLEEFERLTSTFEGFDLKGLSGLHVAASVGYSALVACLLKTKTGQEELNKRDDLANIPLHLAAFYGRANIVEELLLRGSPIDDGKEEGDATPLCMAAYKGQVCIMRKLLLIGADPNARSKEYGPMVNVALYSGNRQAVEIFMEHGASLAVGDDEIPPLSLAASLPDQSMFFYLVETYADRLPAREFNTALVTAAANGRLEALDELLKHDHPQETLQRAVDTSVERAAWVAIPALLKSGEGLNCANLFFAAATTNGDQDSILEIVWEYTKGSIPAETLAASLYTATDNEKESTVRYLLEQCGADANATGDEYGNALTAACFDGTHDIVSLLLQHGADVNSPNGWAIQTAASQGHIEVVRLLLEHGADPNARTTNERFPQSMALQAACEAGKADVVDLLLEHKADPNLGGGDLTYPLLAAARKGEAYILEKLLQAGAKPNIFGGPDMSTPLINAAAMLPRASLEALVDAGADINLPDTDGDTALMLTALTGDLDSLEYLLSRGADPTYVSKRRINALEYAYSMGQEDCARILISRYSAIMKSLIEQAASGNTAVAGALEAARQEEDKGMLVTVGVGPSQLEQWATMVAQEAAGAGADGDGKEPQSAGAALEGEQDAAIDGVAVERGDEGHPVGQAFEAVQLPSPPPEAPFETTHRNDDSVSTKGPYEQHHIDAQPYEPPGPAATSYYPQPEPYFAPGPQSSQGHGLYQPPAASPSVSGSAINTAAHSVNQSVGYDYNSAAHQAYPGPSGAIPYQETTRPYAPPPQPSQTLYEGQGYPEPGGLPSYHGYGGGQQQPPPQPPSQQRWSNPPQAQAPAYGASWSTGAHQAAPGPEPGYYGAHQGQGQYDGTGYGSHWTGR